MAPGAKTARPRGREACVVRSCRPFITLSVMSCAVEDRQGVAISRNGNELNRSEIREMTRAEKRRDRFNSGLSHRLCRATSTLAA